MFPKFDLCRITATIRGAVRVPPKPKFHGRYVSMYPVPIMAAGIVANQHMPVLVGHRILDDFAYALLNS